ncbi:MAG: hypothetical protein IT256_06250 [Chitinophagaceae bacterium]|nr:hypothetical protein [Chitinophagaceae bacterium]
MDRLLEILNATEQAWHANLNYFNGIPIRYILICEAPPWRPVGEEISYFYSQTNGSILKTVWRAFFNNNEVPENAHLFLAQQGFLLVDSIPYSLKYTSNQRRKVAYRALVSNCLNCTIGKINTPGIEVEPNVKIALGFKLNARAFMNATNNVLQIGNGIDHINFTEDNIAADGSGNINSTRLRSILGIQF